MYSSARTRVSCRLPIILTLSMRACYDGHLMNVVMGVLRFGYLALIVAFALYVAWLIKRDLDRR